MCRLLDDKGIISIDASIVMPIVFIILMNFICLIRYITNCEEIDLIAKFTLIENQIITKELMTDKILDRVDIPDNLEDGDQIINARYIASSVISDDKKIITNRIEKNNLLNNVSNINIEKIYNENDYSKIKISYEYKDIFLKLHPNTTSQIRKINDGDLLSEYGFGTESYNLDEDLWNLSNLERGKKVADMLGSNIKPDGSKIDVLDDKYLKSIISIDIRKMSYEKMFNIFDTIKYDVDKLYNFTEGKVGAVNITKDMYNKKMIIIAIPEIEIDTYQKDEFLLIKKYCNTKNIQCKIIIVEGRNSSDK